MKWFFLLILYILSSACEAQNSEDIQITPSEAQPKYGLDIMDQEVEEIQGKYYLPELEEEKRERCATTNPHAHLLDKIGTAEDPRTKSQTSKPAISPDSKNLLNREMKLPLWKFSWKTNIESN